MAEKEIPVFCKHGVVYVITHIVCMKFLFIRINFAIAMDDYVPFCFLPEYFCIDIRNMFMHRNRHIGMALPGMSADVC